MYEGKSVAAVIPVYNEEPFIEDVITTLPSFIDRAYVIDDGSTDGTWARIQKYSEVRSDRPDERGPQNCTGECHRPTEIVPLRHTENRGVGGAIKTGYSRALADGIDVIAVVAGDGQTAPDVIERIVRPVAEGKVDYAKGNRLHRQNRSSMPPFRRVGNYLLSLLTRMASGYWMMMDPQNGSTAISSDVLADIEIGELYEDYGFCNDLLVRLNVNDCTLCNVPRRAVYEDESSHISYRSFIPKTSMLLLHRFLWRIHTKYLVQSFHPLLLWYYLGTALSVLGLNRLIRSPGDQNKRSAALYFGVGALCLLRAMVLDRRENKGIEWSPDDPSYHQDGGRYE